VPTDEAAKARAEEYLAELPDEEFAAVLKRVRPPQPQPGDAGRAEAAKRFPMGPSIPPSDYRPKSNGRSGRDEAARRFRQKEQS
jgi:hypothetical protein